MNGVTLVRRLFAVFVMCVTAGISINVPHFIICHSKCSSICNCLSRGAGDSQSTYHLLSFQSHIRISYLPHYWPGQPANSSTKHFINMRIFGPMVDHEDRNTFQSTPTLHCGWQGGHIWHFVLTIFKVLNSQLQTNTASLFQIEQCARCWIWPAEPP